MPRKKKFPKGVGAIGWGGPKGPRRPKKKGFGKGKGGKKYPFDLTAPLDKKRFKREMKAADRAQHQGVQRQLGRERAAQTFRTQQEIPAFYQQYRAGLAALRGQGDQFSQQMMDRVGQASTQAGEQDSANRAAMMERLQKDAALRGTTVDPNIDLGQTDAQAARANSATTALGTLGGQAANRSAYLTNREAIGFQAEGEARDREYARLRGIYGDQRELAKARGDFRTNFRRDARDSERKYKLERMAVRSDKQLAKLDEKGANFRAKLSAKTSRANSKATQKGQDRRQKRDQRFDKKENKKDRRADKKGKKGKKL